MYDPVMVQPMRDEVTRLGMKEMRTAEEVDKELMRRERRSSLLIRFAAVLQAAQDQL